MPFESMFSATLLNLMFSFVVIIPNSLYGITVYACMRTAYNSKFSFCVTVQSIVSFMCMVWYLFLFEWSFVQCLFLQNMCTGCDWDVRSNVTFISSVFITSLNVMLGLFLTLKSLIDRHQL